MFVSSKRFLSDSRSVNYYDHVKAWEAVTASFSVPVVFRPKLIGNESLVDGGLKNNLPVDVLRLFGAERILSVNLSEVEESKSRFQSVDEIISQSVSIISSALTSYVGERSDFELKPSVKGVNFLEYKKISQCIKIGYDAAVSQMPEILNMIYFKQRKII